MKYTRTSSPFYYSFYLNMNSNHKVWRWLWIESELKIVLSYFEFQIKLVMSIKIGHLIILIAYTPFLTFVRFLNGFDLLQFDFLTLFPIDYISWLKIQLGNYVATNHPFIGDPFVSREKWNLFIQFPSCKINKKYFSF